MQEDSRDADGITMIAARDKMIRRNNRATTRPEVRRTSEAIKRAAAIVRQPSPDDGASAGIDEIPVVDEAKPPHIEREDALAQRFVGSAVELVHEDHKREQPFFVNR